MLTPASPGGAFGNRSPEFPEELGLPRASAEEDCHGHAVGDLGPGVGTSHLREVHPVYTSHGTHGSPCLAHALWPRFVRQRRAAYQEAIMKPVLHSPAATE